MVKNAVLVLYSCLIFLFPAHAFAAAVGRIVSIDHSAFVERDGDEIRLSMGASLLNGDIVVTNDIGKVLITFSDGTDIAVGANSRLDIDEIIMQSNGVAQRFSVNALGGTFRFLSGNSPKGNYDIKTPTATMGIRGTVFDFFVDGNGTKFVLLKGEVLFCSGEGTCVDVVDSCGAVTSGSAGEIGILEGRVERDPVIIDHFPFIRSQEDLLDSHTTETRSCGPVAGQPEPDPRPEPVPVPQPAPEPEPEPAAESKPVPEPAEEPTPPVTESYGNCGKGEGIGGGIGGGKGVGSGQNCGDGPIADGKGAKGKPDKPGKK